MKKSLLFLALILCVNLVSAQNVLKGRVTDAQSQPLHGVSVVEKEPTMVYLPILTVIIPLAIRMKTQ